jgi:exosortase
VSAGSGPTLAGMAPAARAPRAAAWLQALAIAAAVTLTYARTGESLWRTWTTNDNYSHGPLVPLVSLALVWLRRDKLRAAPARPDSRGIALVAAGCAMQVLGVRADLFALEGASLLTVLFGLVLTFFGPVVTRMLAFPIGYLGFMLTFPPVVMNTLSFALKALAVNASVAIAQALGAQLQRDGMRLFFATGELRVEDPCSGLRSLLALLATGALFAYTQKGGGWRRAAVVLAAVPIALAGNIARLVLLFLATSRFGVTWATGRFHDVTGYALYAVALALLVGLRALLTPRASREVKP